jgi:hypothetical protein
MPELRAFVFLGYDGGVENRLSGRMGTYRPSAQYANEELDF